jgi:hypothetical protein
VGGAGLEPANLATKPLSAGTWRLRAKLDDGTTHTVAISLR